MVCTRLHILVHKDAIPHFKSNLPGESCIGNNPNGIHHMLTRQLGAILKLYAFGAA
ncbi:hypothetical protein D3C80_2121110 [compost metagenome]